MRIEWLGHASFLIVAENGTMIITDPYESGAFDGKLRYKPIEVSPDVVTVSHKHADHAYVEGLPGRFDVIAKAGSKIIKGISFKGVETYHDTDLGSNRGNNIVFVMTIDHVRICHLGDLGHELSPDEIESIGEVDILLIPVGGKYTIDAKAATRVVERLHPKIAIPMHFKTDSVDFPIESVDAFLLGKPVVLRLGRSHIEVTKERLPEERQILVLTPSLA